MPVLYARAGAELRGAGGACNVTVGCARGAVERGPASRLVRFRASRQLPIFFRACGAHEVISEHDLPIFFYFFCVFLV